MADGNLIGQWFERGSNNQSGNIGVTEYDVEADKIYTISGGGTLFRGQRDGSNWEVINQDYRFYDRFLKMIELPEKRLLAAIDGIPSYSDDLGQTWTQANSDIEINDFWARLHQPVVVQYDDSYHIYMLTKRDYWDNIRLYASTDNGASYQQITQFDTNEFNSFSLCKPHHTEEVYLFQKMGSNVRLHNINLETQSLELLHTSALNLDDAQANMTATLKDDGVIDFYVYNNNKEVYRSQDQGATWNYRSKMPQQPWEVGLYVSKFDDRKLYTGEVECHTNSGSPFWTTVNTWGEYYNDIHGKLHADIMSFNEFTTNNGQNFVLVGNHGGLSISYDNLETTQNIGLSGLNVSQYYEVRTDPYDLNYIYAGSQDQGFQRGVAAGHDDLVNFGQVISGDYGHIAFSNGGFGMWTVYPGGAVSYFQNAQFGFIVAGYDLNSDNESVWLPPIIETPDPEDIFVYMAGGNVNGGAGSHIIKLNYWAGSIQTNQLPFDFKNASGGEVSAIEISALNAQTMYASTTNGFFYYSYDGGQTWEQSFVIVPEPHYLYGTSIYASTLDENTVYIAGSGYSNPAVYISEDNGQTFAPFDEGLPSTLVFELVANEDESLFFAATEAGAYVYVVSEGRWYDMLGEAAPNQTYWSVEYLEEIQTVRFGTYGRGIWDFQLQEPVGVKDIFVEKELEVYPNPSSGIFTILGNDFLGKEIQLRLFDLGGRLVWQSQTSPRFGRVQEVMDLSKFPKGMYSLQIIDGQEVRTKKIVKH